MSVNSECSSASVEQIAQKLEEAVLSQLNPLVDNHTRTHAYHMMEQVIASYTPNTLHRLTTK